MKCSRCGRNLRGLTRVIAGHISNDVLCPDCEQDDLVIVQRRQKEYAERAERIIVTTTPSIDGHRIVAYRGIESVEIVIGTGFMSELTGEISDFLGQRSKGFESKMQEAKRAAFMILKNRAVDKGANAVVGIDLDYSEFSGNRVALVLNGTLVSTLPVGN